jgi:hypothetical protein
MSDQPAVERRHIARAQRSLGLSLDGFAWDALEREATAEGLTIEQLVTFAVLYYLADRDSGRIARNVATSPYPG